MLEIGKNVRTVCGMELFSSFITAEMKTFFKNGLMRIKPKETDAVVKLMRSLLIWVRVRISTEPSFGTFVNIKSAGKPGNEL